MGLKVSLDTNIFLNVKNKERPFYNYSKIILEAIDTENKDIKGILSIISITELLVGYYMNDEMMEKNEFLSGLFSSKNYKICDLDLNIAEKAAVLRSKVNLRLPDCLIIATAQSEGVNCLITNDKDFQKAEKFIDIFTSQDFCEKYLK